MGTWSGSDAKAVARWERGERAPGRRPTAGGRAAAALAAGTWQQSNAQYGKRRRHSISPIAKYVSVVPFTLYLSITLMCNPFIARAGLMKKLCVYNVTAINPML